MKKLTRLLVDSLLVIFLISMVVLPIASLSIGDFDKPEQEVLPASTFLEDTKEATATTSTGN